MKKSVINTVKNGAVKTIGFTGAVLHTATVGTAMAIHGVGDMVYSGSEILAKGEGYVVNKIDNTKSKDEVILHRQMATTQNFLIAQSKMNDIKLKAIQLTNQAKSKAAEAISVVKDTVAPKKDVIAELRKTKTGRWNVLVNGNPVKRNNGTSNFNEAFEDEDAALLWIANNLQ